MSTRFLIAAIFSGLAVLNLMWFAAALGTTLADARPRQIPWPTHEAYRGGRRPYWHDRSLRWPVRTLRCCAPFGLQQRAHEI